MVTSSGSDVNAAPPSVNSLREEMRRRRPHLFSDTIRSSEPQISKEVLDYHLETLTKRKQEYQFEHFARALAEKELCPNLRTQTGPTGGGDAKVDSETYPVAPDIAERWFLGETAAKERWAFAFSTKEAWQVKVKSDVASIASTDRKYDRIYCITSRYAPDKARAALEDKLSTQVGVCVTILDRAWILDKIYTNNHLSLAVETLGLTAVEVRTAQIGPNDAARSRRLEELDLQVGDPHRYREARYSLAEDCFTSALLARGLERPRAEVEARFAQARRFAEECGVAEQRRRILYFEAWTALWWYEDQQRLLDNYVQLEALAADTSYADDLEQIMTLWQLLSGSCIRGVLDPARIDLEGKQERLVNQLRKLSDDATRPNNSLQAKYSLAILDAHGALAARDTAALDQVWISLIPLIAEGETLLSLPLERMVETLEAMSDFVSRSDAYEELLDSFLPLLERRRSNAAAGQALMRRGMQKLDAGQYEDAVRLLGRAELRLAKEEHIQAFVELMLGMASAYLALGLPWAARTKLLMAVDRSFAIMKDDGDIPPSLIRSLHNLTWVEIQLGRLPQSLAAWRHLRTISAQFEVSASDRAALDSDFHLLARLLGHMLLNGTLDQLTVLTRLPDALRKLGLELTAMLLLWGLGHEGVVRDRYLAHEDRDEDLQALFYEELSHPAVKSLPRRIIIGNAEPLTLSARALGCELRFTLPNDAAAIHVAEAVASAFEAFLATSLKQKVAPYRDYLRFDLQPGPTERFATTWYTTPETWAKLTYPTSIIPETKADRTGFAEWLRDLIGETIARTLYMHNPKEWLSEVAGTEEGFSRAISLGNVPVLVSSVFGDKPLHKLDYWICDDWTDYPLLRTESWTHGASSRDGGVEAEAAMPRADRRTQGSENPFAFNDHSRVRVTSIIDLPLWDRARWSGTGVAVIGDQPPILALSFQDIKAGIKIFEGWQARFGTVDEEEAIRIAIIQGLSHCDPTGYAVTVGRNVDAIHRENPDAILTMLSRINRMEKASPENLMNFLVAYHRHGSYRLVPMQMTTKVTQDAFRFELAITKRKLEVRRAWQIGPDDPDMSALRDNDDPIIPSDIDDPPVREALARIREFRARQRAGENWDGSAGGGVPT
jgi:hypothetical protein